LFKFYTTYEPYKILKGGTIVIEIASIQKLLKQALLYRLMTNIEKMVSTANLSHQEISSRTGRKGNWFNDAFNNNEDIKISSLAKILSVINSNTDINQYQLADIFDKKVVRIANVISCLADEDLSNIKNFLYSERDLFMDLIGDWGSLDSKKKLTGPEHACFKEILQVIKQFPKEGQS
jgi:hypothetical protein